jgi:hypothetical protein
VTALEVFRAYAHSNGANGHPPSQSDYEALGILGVSNTNREVINALIAGKSPVQVDSQGEIQGIVNGYVPLVSSEIIKRIFVIGSSTVHAGWFRSGDFNDPYGDNRVLEGWAEELGRYMLDPAKVYNRALSGSCSVWYRDPQRYMAPVYFTRAGIIGRDWNSTEQLTKDTNDSQGGFLLIQFGAREAYTASISVEDFENALRDYVADAKRLGLIPVLISPPGARSHGANTRPYAQYIKPIAEETNAVFIDLYEKSKTVWQTYTADGEGKLPIADMQFSYKERHSGINNTHYGRNGAKIVSGWIRELACESYADRSEAVQADAAALCSQFVRGELEHNITMREDAEDGDVDGWETYGATDGSTITNVYNVQKRSNVIVLHGNDGLDNGFRYTDSPLWEEEDEFIVSWEMNYSNDFTFFISVDTEDGYKIFEYKPTDNVGEIVSARYRFGLGSDANNGTWHTFTRDMQADLQQLDPGKHILRIHRIAVRGSGMIDTIRTMQSIDSESRDIAPTVAVVDEAEITVNKNSVYVDAGVTVVDDKDEDIAIHLEMIGSVDTSIIGSYVLHYKVHDSVGNGGYARRTVNVVEAGAEVVTVHEDAEDGDTVGWGTYGTGTNPAITNTADHGGHTITLQGDDGLENGFSYPSFATNSGFVASWSLKYSESFRLFILVHSTNPPHANIYMEYTPHDISRGVDGAFIHNGLGANANDGTWHTFTRDVAADFNVVYPDANLTEIVGFAIRGSGSIDDLSTSTRAPKEIFSSSGHTYKIVKTASTWQDASTAAHNGGGYLVNIGSIAENHEIYSRLYRYITHNEYTDSVASNGGGATYVWIGANDMSTEGTWVWENNSQQFWSGTSAGNAENGLYGNWGKNTHDNEQQREPDNAGNQDAAAMALTEWQVGSGTLGQASQWNDLKVADPLYYIIEYDN